MGKHLKGSSTRFRKSLHASLHSDKRATVWFSYTRPLKVHWTGHSHLSGRASITLLLFECLTGSCRNEWIEPLGAEGHLRPFKNASSEGRKRLLVGSEKWFQKVENVEENGGS